MKKAFFLFLLLNLTVFNISAQEIEYVISNPGKTEFKKLNNSDSTIIPNPDYTSYFLNSTSYTLKKKTIRLSGTDIIFVKGSYGLTNNTTVSVNISLFGTLSGSVKQQIHLTDDLKLGISVSGGQILSTLNNSNNQYDTSIYFGGGQAMVTLGNKQDNITIGSGIYYIKSTIDLYNGNKELVTHNVYVGAQKQFGRKWYFMIEGMYFINYQIFTGAIGVKLIIGDRISLNCGLMPFAWNNPGTNQIIVEPIVIPLISFRMLLGRNR